MRISIVSTVSSVLILSILSFCVLTAVTVSPRTQSAQSLLILGDSLSAAYGMAVDQGWVRLLQKRLQAKGYNYTVTNASISGDTSAGALTRLRAMDTQPDVAIISIGGNDGLRGLPVAGLRRNLSGITSHLTDSGTRVLLLRMRAPPNYGPGYTEEFDRTYDRMAADGVDLGPFILADLIDHPRWMQADGVHPTAAAQPRILDTVWPHLEPLLQSP